MKETRKKNKKYSPEFKITVIMDMRENKLSYHETMRKYFSHLASSKNFAFLLNWERIKPYMFWKIAK